MLILITQAFIVEYEYIQHTYTMKYMLQRAHLHTSNCITEYIIHKKTFSHDFFSLWQWVNMAEIHTLCLYVQQKNMSYYDRLYLIIFKT